MSEAGWGTDKPTVAGWYWIRDPRFVLSGGVKVVYITTKDLMMDWGSTAEFLGPITPDAYAAGRVASLAEVERYMAMRLRLAEASLATEILAGNEVKQGRERAAIAELHGMQRHVADIKEQIEAQGGEHVVR